MEVDHTTRISHLVACDHLQVVNWEDGFEMEMEWKGDRGGEEWR